MSARCVFAVGLALGVVSGAHAAPSAPTATAALTLETVLGLLDTRYPALLAARTERAQAEAILGAAQGGFDPQLRGNGAWEATGPYPTRYVEGRVDQPTPLWGLSVFGGYRLGVGTFAVYDEKRLTNDAGELFGGIRVPLWRDGPIDARRAALEQGEIGVRLADLSIAQQRLDLRRTATLRYFDWVAAGLRVQVIEDWLELALTRDAAIGARIQQGDIPDIERTENQRTILQRRGAALSARQALLEASLALSLFLRGEDGRPRVPGDAERPPRLPEPGLTPAVVSAAREQRAVERRPDVASLVVQRERVGIERALAQNAGRPAVDFTTSASADFGDGNKKLNDTALVLGLSLDIPTLNRAADGRAAAARAAEQRLLELERLARDRVSTEVQAAAARIEAARRRAEVAREELRVAHLLAEAEVQRFELGESNLLLVNLREQASAEADLRNVDALLDLQRAVADYRLATADDGAVE